MKTAETKTGMTLKQIRRQQYRDAAQRLADAKDARTFIIGSLKLHVIKP